MNKTIAQIKIKDALSSLPYYESLFNGEIRQRYVAKQLNTPPSFQGKLALAIMMIRNEIEILISEHYDVNYPEMKGIYLQLEASPMNEAYVKALFAKLTNETILCPPDGNRTGTFYGAFKDRFDVVGEFKIGRY